MRIGIVLGAALAFAPALALADQTQNQNPPAQTQNQNQPQTQNQNQAQNPSEMTTQRLLPKDAKLVGTVESTDVRAFPEQMSKAQSANIEKEGLVGVGALDRVWTTKQSYHQTVSRLDQNLKGEGIQPIAKTTTQSSTAWNMRMPDGHIANVVVRNTQPTTIEAVQASVVSGTMSDTNRMQNQNPNQKQPQNQLPSTKNKTNP
jgi:hypothetical protein